MQMLNLCKKIIWIRIRWSEYWKINRTMAFHRNNIWASHLFVILVEKSFSEQNLLCRHSERMPKNVQHRSSWTMLVNIVMLTRTFHLYLYELFVLISFYLRPIFVRLHHILFANNSMVDVKPAQRSLFAMATEHLIRNSNWEFEFTGALFRTDSNVFFFASCNNFIYNLVRNGFR